MRYLIFIILLIIGCAKSYDIDMEHYSNINYFYNSLNLPYKYEIKINTPMYAIKFFGKKDGIKQFTLKGTFNILNEKNKYNVFYNNVNWYNIENGKLLESEYPINPVEFIENMLKDSKIEYIKQKGNIAFYKATLNLAMISPLNYEREGILKIKFPQKRIMEISVNDKDIDLNIKLQYEKSIFFNVKLQTKDSIKIYKNINSIEKRLSFGLGFIDDNYAKFYEKNKYNELIINTEKIQFAQYQYIEPGIDENEKYLFDDLRNTIKITNTFNIDYSIENILIEQKGLFFNIIIDNVNIYAEREKICAVINNICFPVNIIDNKLTIINIKKEIIKQFLSVLYYPFNLQ